MLINFIIAQFFHQSKYSLEKNYFDNSLEFGLFLQNILYVQDNF